MQAYNIAYVVPCESARRRAHGDGGEVNLVRQTTYYDPQVVVSLTFGEWTDKVHSYGLPRAARDGQVVQ